MPKETVEKMLKGREEKYGSFEEHATIAQELKCAMQTSRKWESLSDDKKEALEMIQHKVARILNGDPEYDDNWRDIAGYATLVENTLNKAKVKPYEEIGV